VTLVLCPNPSTEVKGTKIEEMEDDSPKGKNPPRAWYVSNEESFKSVTPPIEFTIESEGGRLSCVYDPGRALVGLFNSFGRLFAELAQESREAALESDLLSEEAERLITESERAEVFAHFEYARDQLLAQLQPKLEEALYELCNQLIVQAIHDLGKMGGKAQAMKRLEKAFLKRRNARIGITRGGSEPSFNLSQLLAYYAQLLPRWQNAKRIYRQNKKQAEWPSIVAAGEKDLLPDLIARLADAPDLSNDLLTKLERHGGGSSPSDIALEHAARMCGAPPYAYTLRHLQGLLKEQRKNTEVQSSVLDFTKKRPF
jgi:hypothetical protein